MTQIGFSCDRCGGWVDGLIVEGHEDWEEVFQAKVDTHSDVTISDDNFFEGIFTSGFYNVGEGKAWHEYRMMPDEERVCDDCIQSMPLYKDRFQKPRFE